MSSRTTINPLIILVISAFLVFAVGALQAPNSGVRETSTARSEDFTEKMHCPVCLVLASELRRQSLANQPPPEGKDWTAARRKKYIKREDRIDDVINAAFTASSAKYIWVDETSAAGSIIAGRYWRADVLRARGHISEESLKRVEQQEKNGGDLRRENFMRMSLIGEAEDDIEALIGQNVTDVRKLQEALCIKTNVCAEDMIAAREPRDEL
eukprot:PhM_4_TR2547/c0_g1_i1/m.13396